MHLLYDDGLGLYAWREDRASSKEKNQNHSGGISFHQRTPLVSIVPGSSEHEFAPGEFSLKCAALLVAMQTSALPLKISSIYVKTI